jgi:hypothetical protein
MNRSRFARELTHPVPHAPRGHAHKHSAEESIAKAWERMPSGERLHALTQAFGNQAIATVLTEDDRESCSCGGTCPSCAQQRIETLGDLGIHTDPPDYLEDEAVPPGAPPLVPVDPNAGGTVVCKDGGFEVLLLGVDSCTAPCARRHEEKHIADFQADPNYKDICKGIPNGETFNYRNCSDESRFETAASDVEIDCLAASIPTASTSCKPIMQQRKDKTLPEYKKKRSSCGC